MVVSLVTLASIRNARAANCTATLSAAGSCGTTVSGTCPQSAPIETCTVNQSGFSSTGTFAAGANAGSAAAHALVSGSLGTQFQASGLQTNLDFCQISGPDNVESVLTRMRYEAAAALHISQVADSGNGTTQTASVTLRPAVSAAPTFNQSQLSMFWDQDSDEDNGVANCFLRTGIFLSVPCTRNISIPRKIFVGPEFSAPVGSNINFTFLAFANSLTDRIDNDFPSASVSVSLPSDDSPVLVLPEGFTLNCDGGEIVDNVWQGAPVDQPPPIPVPSLSMLSLIFLGTFLIGVGAWTFRRVAAKA